MPGVGVGGWAFPPGTELRTQPVGEKRAVTTELEHPGHEHAKAA